MSMRSVDAHITGSGEEVSWLDRTTQGGFGTNALVLIAPLGFHSERVI